MRMTLDELINAMEPQARKDKALDRLIETALQELDQKLPEAGGEAALSHISDQIRQDAQLDEQHRKLMLDYIRQLNQVTCRQCRHLYRQGALDCVLLLRGLGVIR